MQYSLLRLIVLVTAICVSMAVLFHPTPELFVLTLCVWLLLREIIRFKAELSR